MSTKEGDTSIGIEPNIMASPPADLLPVSYPPSTIPQSQSSAAATTGILGSIGGLEKLQTFLPTGTWMLYTALQTWAFTIGSSNLAPPPPPRCTPHQRIALICVISVMSAIAFTASFVKRFVYDTAGTQITYPPPDMLEVSSQIKDPVTEISFPHKVGHNQTSWPFVDPNGDFVYNEKGGVRAIVFKHGVEVRVSHGMGYKRFWGSAIRHQHAAYSSELFSIPPAAGQTLTVDHTLEVEVDRIVAPTPVLQPRWTRIIMFPNGSKSYYIDFRNCVWEHAIVSLLAFGTLALLSDPVKSCLFPSLADYVAPIVQTAMLVILGAITTGLIRDDAVNLGQTAPCQLNIEEEPKHTTQNMPSTSGGDPANRLGEGIPSQLKTLVLMVVWMRRVDQMQA